MLKTYGDPFRGAKERRIAAPGERTSDYELKAAQKAMANAGVGPEDIDFMLVFSVPPDQYLPGDGAALHHRLGIRRGLVANVDLACASFVGGLAIADSMLRAGQANMVLFVTGELLSRLADWDDPASVGFGDGAAAAVIGPTRDGTGFIAHAGGTDGSKYEGVSCAPKSAGPWYAGAGPLLLYGRDVELGRSVVMNTTHYAELAVSAVLERAQLERQRITHFYCHQASSWFNQACKRALRLEHCKTTDTFTRYANIGAPNIPINLAHARQDGDLARGDLVLMFTFGMGIVWASSLMYWSC